jgi:hypothetical protein
MNRKLKSRLDIVWSNNAKPKRYIPRALNGGPGWGVFDRREDRFLKDAEVVKLNKESLSEIYVN